MSASVRAKLWREELKSDPVRWEEQRLNDIERNQRNRQRPKSEEEKARQRELSRQRMQKSRAKKKAEQAAAARDLPASTPTPKPVTRSVKITSETALEDKRKKAREQKRAERAKWSTQKWRRHREKNLAAYHARKQKKACPSPAPDPDSGSPWSPPQSARKSAAARKSRSRLKQFLRKSGISLETVSKIIGKPETPASKRVKRAVDRALADLKAKNDKKSLAKKKLLFEVIQPNSTSPAVVSPYKRRKRNMATEAAVRYMEEHAVPLPGKKTVSRKHQMQTKVLPKRLKRLRRDFIKDHSEVRASLRTFYRHRPKHIKTSRQQSYRQGLCEVCINIDLKLDALNPCMTETIDGRNVLSEMSLCPTPSLACLDRKCGKCGLVPVEEAIQSRLQTDMSSPVKWHSWDTVKKDAGQQRKEKVEHEGTIGELINLLLKDLVLFSKHVFTYRWQYQAYRSLLSRLPSLPKTAVAVCDFAENHLCKYQDEVASAHWGYSQVTVHPCVLFYPCGNCKTDLVTDYLVFLSDDLNHDAHIVEVIFQRTKSYLKDASGVDKFVIWSDGCSAQYKSKLPFFYASDASDTHRAFFGSRHGKSPCDACGGVVKAISGSTKNGPVYSDN